MVDIMSFGMELVGSLSVFDVLFVLVVMNGACVLLVRWSVNVRLCRLVDISVAVCGGSDGWRWYLAACCSSWCWYR